MSKVSANILLFAVGFLVAALFLAPSLWLPGFDFLGPLMSRIAGLGGDTINSNDGSIALNDDSVADASNGSGNSSDDSLSHSPVQGLEVEHALNRSIGDDEVGSSRSEPGGQPAVEESNSPPPEVWREYELAEILRAARLEEGSDISMIAAYRLEQIRDYEIMIMPEVKKAALGSLLSRFTQTDWKGKGGLTPYSNAYHFVSRIQAVNSQLGLYLRISSLMFQDMYRRILIEGKAYRTAKMANELAELKVGIVERPGYREDTASVILDPTFRRVFERLKSEFAAQYVRQYPDRVVSSLVILSSVEPQHSTRFARGVVAEFLARIALEGPPADRISLLHAERKLKVLRGFALLSRNIRYLAANFCLVTAVDLIEEGNFELANWALNESVRYDPTLPTQGLVAKRLNRNLASLGRHRPASMTENEEVTEQTRPAQNPTPEKIRGIKVNARDLDLAQPRETEQAQHGSATGTLWWLLIIGGVVVIILTKHESFGVLKYGLTVRYRLLRKIIYRYVSSKTGPVSVYHRDASDK